MLDATGEVVAEAGASDERHRLIAIYQGIVLAAARRALGRLPAGDIRYVLIRYEAHTLILRPLRDGYYVVVTLGPRGDLARGIRRSAAAQDRMNEAM
jgi:predicted regulator of Ras-like GTPase activity (Roadblock/LC7/MglB family)